MLQSTNADSTSEHCDETSADELCSDSVLQTLQAMLGDDDDVTGTCGDDTNSCGLGRIHFHISYDFSLCSLVVKIHEAENLPAMDANGKSDPYVKVRRT